MREGDWQEILQHPQRALTSGQWDLLAGVNVASLGSERRAALIARLIIEGRRLYAASHVPGREGFWERDVGGGKRTYEPDPKQGKKK